MPGVNYSRSASGSRLFISSGPPTIWQAFLLSTQSTFNQDQIQLPACWRERGAAFLFAPEPPPAIDQTFIDALWQAILQKTPQFLWNAMVFLLDPQAPPSAGNIWTLSVTQPSTNQFRVFADTPLALGNGAAEFRFRENARVSLQDEGIRFEWPNFHPMETFLQGQPFTVQTSRSVDLPLSGPSSGCFLFDLHLREDTQLPQLDLGLKYFFEENNSLRELHFPLFRPGPDKNGAFFHASFDPSQPLNPLRTGFTFTGESRRQVTPAPAATETIFDSAFKTLNGYPIRLKPQKDRARLVFSRRGADTASPWYLVPEGEFAMEIAPPHPQTGMAKLLTGFSGAETLLFHFESGKTLLRFHPHRPAFAPMFPPPPSSHTNRFRMEEHLGSRCQTAWLSIAPAQGQPVFHVSQPDGGPLYLPDAEDAGTPVFDYIDTTIPLPADPDFCLPIAPHGPPGMTAFENQVLNPARKALVDGIRQTLPPPQTGVVHTATPQGNLVKLRPQGNQWTELLLGEDAPGNQLRFDLPPLPLQKAFQTSQQFLVVTSADNLGTFQNQLHIAGWPFRFNTGQNQRLGDYSNVLIFKFCSESLLDRIKNPALWTQPKDFNGPNDLELQLLSRWLQDYIGDAIGNQADNPYFQDFIRLVQNPRWNGVLALKADISLDNMPAELQGLIGGIDASRFNAHHVGMEINQVENAAGSGLRYKEKSSFFGLVYYQDPAYRHMTQAAAQGRPSSFPPETFDFRVLTLFALFKNSQIASFSSSIRVMLRELFREKLTPGTADFIDLQGTHEKKNGKDTYTFLSENPVNFEVASSLYQHIGIGRAAFVTHPREENSREVRSAFHFSGGLFFEKLAEDYDMLSFDGLAFSNLQLDFSFNLDNPSLRSFAMQYGSVRFNLAGSPLRQSALLAEMPFEVKSFRFGSGSELPAQLGYLPVELAGLDTAPIKGEWFGLECVLHMGSAGDLSNLGSLSAPALLAWAPGSKPGRHSVSLGLKLPGADPNAKMLSIQGLLRLSVDNLQLVHTTQGFILKLNDISLKFFGLAKIPPGGSTSFYVFSHAAAGKREAGWYAAYNKDPQP